MCWWDHLLLECFLSSRTLGEEKKEGEEEVHDAEEAEEAAEEEAKPDREAAEEEAKPEREAEPKAEGAATGREVTVDCTCMYGLYHKVEVIYMYTLKVGGPRLCTCRL